MKSDREQPEALRLADALEDTDGAHDHDQAAAELRRLHEENKTLCDRLAQSEPEPVSHRYFREIYEVWAGSEGIPLPKTCTEGYLLHLIEQMRDIAKEGLKHTAPPKREWVGLTEADIYDAMNNKDEFDFAEAIEAKLKEKNT